MSHTESPPGRILLVDDDPHQTRALALLLERLIGEPVVVVGSGREALAAFDASSTDIVLCDIHLPDMDGRELVRELRARAVQRRVGFAALSGFAPEGAGERTEFDEYFLKPVDVTGLADFILDWRMGQERGDPRGPGR